MSHRSQIQRCSRKLQLGTAAVELAVILSATMVLMPALVLFAKAFYQYSAMKVATDHAASYMASLAPTAYLDADQRAIALAKVVEMVNQSAVAAGLSGQTEVYDAIVLCDDFQCGATVPKNIQVLVSFNIKDTLFSGLTGGWTDAYQRTWTIGATSTVAYAR